MIEGLVVFDLDGTLYKTDEVSVPALRRAFSSFGVDISREDILKQFGEHTDQIIINLTPEDKMHLKNKIKNEIAKNEAKMIPVKGTLYQGVKSMLKELKERGYELAICSNGREDYIQAVLKSTSIDKYFSSIKSYIPGKSKAENLKELLDEFGPQKAVMVGDRYHDIEAAEEVGIPSLAVRYGYGPDQETKKADYTVSRAEDIVDVVEDASF